MKAITDMILGCLLNIFIKKSSEYVTPVGRERNQKKISIKRSKNTWLGGKGTCLPI